MALLADKTLDAVRQTEQRLNTHFGLEPLERMLILRDLDTRVRVVEYSGDASAPPVVFLHGIASVTAASVPLIAQLTGRRILAVDTPGHGLSDPYRIPHGDDAGRHLSGMIGAVLDDAKATKGDVVAHSLGGQIALRSALAHAGRIRRLVLVGAPGAAFAGVRPVPAMRAFALPGIGTALLRVPTSLDSYRRNSKALLGAHAMDEHPDEITEAGWLASRRPDFAPSVASYFRALLSARGVRPGVALTSAELDSLDIPTLMIWGEDDIFLTPAVGASEFARIHDGELHRMSGGHAPWLDHPDTVGRLVHDFLHDTPSSTMTEESP